MDYHAYHNALDQGFSEAEATRIGEDAYFDKVFADVDGPEEPGPFFICEICGEHEAVTSAKSDTHEILVCSEECYNLALARLAG